MRVTLAISLADSNFQTAWIARSVSARASALVTPAITAFRALSASAQASGSLPGRDLGSVEDLQHFPFPVAGDCHEAPRVLQRLFHRVCANQREAVDQFLGLCVLAVGDGELAGRERDARA